jgi:hypothetical protein
MFALHLSSRFEISLRLDIDPVLLRVCLIIYPRHTGIVGREKTGRTPVAAKPAAALTAEPAIGG